MDDRMEVVVPFKWAATRAVPLEVVVDAVSLFEGTR